MIEKSDLILWVLGNVDTKEDVSHTRLHKTVYLMQNVLKKEKPDLDLYKFDEFMSHTGPYDPELQEDLEILFETRCVVDAHKPYNKTSPTFVPTHDMQLSNMGSKYMKNHASKEMRDLLGNAAYDKITDIVKSYNRKSEIELIRDAMLEWSKEHPYKQITNLIPQI